MFTPEIYSSALSKSRIDAGSMSHAASAIALQQRIKEHNVSSFSNSIRSGKEIITNFEVENEKSKEHLKRF